jgi:hypothetical protein
MSPTPEIVMGDGGMISDSIVGLKLATLRAYKKGKYPGVETGSDVNLTIKRDSIPAVCLSAVKDKPITDFEIPLLALDGFFDYQTAVEEMKQFYHDYSLTAPSALFVYAAKELIEKIYPHGAGKSLTGQIEEVLRRPQNTELFYPSLAGWFFIKGMGERIDDWYEWMDDQKLISPKQKDFLGKWKKTERLEHNALSIVDFPLSTIQTFFNSNRKMTPIFEHGILMRESTT